MLQPTASNTVKAPDPGYAKEGPEQAGIRHD